MVTSHLSSSVQAFFSLEWTEPEHLDKVGQTSLIERGMTSRGGNSLHAIVVGKLFQWVHCESVVGRVAVSCNPCFTRFAIKVPNVNLVLTEGKASKPNVVNFDCTQFLSLLANSKALSASTSGMYERKLLIHPPSKAGVITSAVPSVMCCKHSGGMLASLGWHFSGIESKNLVTLSNHSAFPACL